MVHSSEKMRWDDFFNGLTWSEYQSKECQKKTFEFQITGQMQREQEKIYKVKEDERK